ncbi:hypothetical protein ACW95P_01565 [Candidatus Mycoplasma pogonae]
MKKLLLFGTAPLIIGVVGCAEVVAQKQTFPNDPIDKKPIQKPKEPETALQLTLEKINNLSNIKNLAINNNKHFYFIDSQGNLKQSFNGIISTLIENIHPESPIYVDKQKISLIDINQNYVMLDLQNNKAYRSDIKTSLKGGFVHLNFATIIVHKVNDKYYLARIETNGNNLVIVAKSQQEITHDAKPLAVGLINQTDKHIAVLAKPSSNSDYRHGVLGDEIESKQIIFLERHNLRDLLTPLTLNNSEVFEENRLQILRKNNVDYLVTVRSGWANHGAQIAVIENKNNSLKIAATGTPLPPNRWMSAFVYKNSLSEDAIFVNYMPHFKREVWNYSFENNNLIERAITNKYHPSLHEISNYNTAIIAQVNDWLLMPDADHKNLLLYSITKNEFKEVANNSKIKNIYNTENSFYVLLENGNILTLKVK